MTDSSLVAHRTSRRRAVTVGAVGGALLLCAVVLGVWILNRGPEPFAVDEAWNRGMIDVDGAGFDTLAMFLNVAGGVLASSLIVPGVAIAVLLYQRRPWSVGYLVASLVLSALFVQALKHLFGRARPEDILVVSDYGSYPSGHVANAATLAAILVVLHPRIWTAIAASVWVVIMALSRTYLHAHWLSDTLGGALVGVGIALACAAFMAERLRGERRPGRAVPAG
ncbi:phosphatase PAP2 family protein [Microbacterium sp. cx-59]|uniref:phosphatase PAP2 family protein n=1 Tax=Microbacterium sp. cx-59 TaxID=2891207 RepID=UPI001E35E73B|nr:phosphatase PAP2 family protein [Microbacterium sp. cx-59]MCC4909016.1 phosphatase PAP2 family protein [Microbacterium sp. cx-59]